MKLGKTLIVTGILFSSILGSVSVGSITAMAADQQETQPSTGNANVSDKKEVTIHFISVKDGSKVSEDVKISVGKEDTKVASDKISIPKGYKVVDNKDTFEIGDGNTINVTLEKESDVLTQNITIHFTDKKNNKEIKEDRKLKIENNKVSVDQIVIPNGYKLSDKVTGFDVTNNAITVNIEKVPTPKPSKPARYVVQRVRITFVDQSSKALVGFKQVTGKDSFSTKIEAPKGYAFVNDKDATIKFDKKGNKDINVAVKLMTAAPIKQEGTLTTNGGSYKRLYTLEGKLITNRALGANSKWYTDQYATVNGSKMYRVATNEWVKASDVH